MVKNFEDMFIRFDRTHERDRQTDRQTNGRTDTACWHILRLCIASRGKNEKNRKINLTNNRKKQIREHTWHIHLSMYKFTLFYPWIFYCCCKISLGSWKLNRSWHNRRMSLVLKSFINNLFIMKSRDLSCDCLIGSISKPYNKIGICGHQLENHFLRCNMPDFSEDTVKCPVKAAFCGV